MGKKGGKIIIFALILFLLFTKCDSILNPPKIQKVSQTFLENYNDIVVVREYLCDSGYVDFQIRKGNTEAWADGNKVYIQDQEVCYALKSILKHYHFISKSGSTITLEQWNRFNDVGCGIACSIDGSSLPEIDFLTKIEQIPNTDWYYYIDDFNEWRLQQKTA